MSKGISVLHKFIDAAGLSDKAYVELANPQSPDTRRIRASLVPQLLEVVASNLRWLPSFGVFEREIDSIGNPD